MLLHLGLKQVFSVVLAREDVMDPETGRKDDCRVLQLLCRDADDCVVVEDSRTGMAAAVMAGIFCIGIANRSGLVFEEGEGMLLTDRRRLGKVLGVRLT